MNLRYNIQLNIFSHIYNLFSTLQYHSLELWYSSLNKKKTLVEENIKRQSQNIAQYLFNFLLYVLLKLLLRLFLYIKLWYFQFLHINSDVFFRLLGCFVRFLVFFFNLEKFFMLSVFLRNFIYIYGF